MPVDDALRDRILTWFFNNTAIPAINRICLNDGTSDRDCTTSLTFTRDYSNKILRITCSLTATANYTINRVNVYSGTTRYFTTSLATPVGVTSGANVVVTWQVRIYSITPVPATFTGANSDRIDFRIISDLSGDTTNKFNAPTNIIYIDTTRSTTTDIILRDVTLTKTLISAERRVRYEHDYVALAPGATPGTQYQLNEICITSAGSGATSFPHNIGSKNWCANNPNMLIRVFGGNRVVEAGQNIRTVGVYSA